MDPETPGPDRRSAPRSALAQWISPDADSSWTALRVSTAVWSLLALTWLLYLVLGDVETYRLVLYPLLILVALFQVLSNIGAMRKKREREGGGGGGGAGWYQN